MRRQPRPQRGMLAMVALLAAGLIAAGCGGGGGGDEDGGGEAGGLPEGRYTAEITAQHINSVPHTRELPPGAWELDVVPAPEGTVLTFFAPPGGTIEEQAEVVGERIEFAAGADPLGTGFHCDAAGEARPGGEYTWEGDQESLTFEAVDDRCIDRVAVLAAESWSKAE